MPCGGPGGGAAGLIAAINSANSAGTGEILLAPNCAYSLTSPNNDSNGLPVVTANITIPAGPPPPSPVTTPPSASLGWDPAGASRSEGQPSGEATSVAATAGAS